MNPPLPFDFYNRPTTLVAQELLGKILVRCLDDQLITGRIVETEAYLSTGDAAAHGAAGLTKRTRILFEEPGHAYVYQLRVYYLLNIVTEPAGVASCVLLRALEPLEGIEYLRHTLADRLADRPVKDTQLMNGPGKLCRALQINLTHYGTDITAANSPFYITEGTNDPFEIETSMRIGITKSSDLPYRFTIKGNPFVSR
jgi:DNA-3-methyladenine glycosylase